MSNVIVIGGGIIGLWTADVLNSRGHKVTVYSSQPIDATSSSSAACVITPLFPSDWKPHEKIFKTAWERYQRTIAKFHLIDEGRNPTDSFLEKIPSYEFGYEEGGEKYLEKEFNIKSLKHLPFSKFDNIPLNPPVRVQNHLNEIHTISFCTRFVADYCNTEVFLSYLYKFLKRQGVSFQFKTVKSLEEVRSPNIDVVFNCMGFSSPKLFPDDSLFPIRGQSMFIIEEQQEGPYFGIASGNHAIFKHRKGFYIGSYFLDEPKLSLVPKQIEFDLSIKFAQGPYKTLCKRLGIDVPNINFDRISRVNAGIRPFRLKGPRVEADYILVNSSPEGLRVVHNYGHGAHGWTVGYGSAEDAVNIAEEMGWID